MDGSSTLGESHSASHFSCIAGKAKYIFYALCNNSEWDNQVGKECEMFLPSFFGFIFRFFTNLVALLWTIRVS